ncbi:adenylate/guanylate cyclase domain-containing protein [Pelagibius sp.]|uniref:adenylate/guanylate cyclase domain-containing protein n=1 Tax=Pelagibius sp. TaxID=1931238 RepID=UPI002622E7EB|nr:adenylate/guanylate cyclase domain-containing protein [Pelagibius sp.]
MTSTPTSEETPVAAEGGGLHEPESAGRWRPTIAVVLTGGFGLLVLVAVSLVLWVSLSTAGKNTMSLLRQTAELTVEALIGEIALHLGTAHQQSQFMAEVIGSGDLDPTDRDRLGDAMLGALAAAPQVTGVAYFSVDGWSLRVGRAPEGGIIRLYDAVEKDPEIGRLVANMAERSNSDWGGVFWVPSLEQPHLTVSTPLWRDGEYLGVIASVVSVQVLSNYVEEFEVQSGLHAFVLYGRNRVLAHPFLIDNIAGLGPDKPLPDIDEVGDSQLAAIWSEGKRRIDILEDSTSSLLGHLVIRDGDEVFFLYRVVGGYGPEQLYMGVYAGDDEIDQTEFERLVVTGWVGLGVLALALLTAVVLSRGIARPVRDLAEAARAISSFDFRRVPPAKGSAFRELNSASGAFNSMLNGLRWFETYVPRTLVLRLIQLGEDGFHSEERQVTVLFTDIVGFARASQNMSAHELAEFLNHHFELLAAEIEKTEGTVDKYIGDSVMAFWGAPDDQPDHAERACRAALAIAAALDRDNRAREAEGEPAVRLRIGIHSGPAIVGNIGAPGRVNYTLIGDTVNLANRLEAFGKEVPPGSGSAVVLLSGETRALLGDSPAVESLGTHEMRGRAGKIEVFRLKL